MQQPVNISGVVFSESVSGWVVTVLVDDPKTPQACHGRVVHVSLTPSLSKRQLLHSLIFRTRLRRAMDLQPDPLNSLRRYTSLLRLRFRVFGPGDQIHQSSNSDEKPNLNSLMHRFESFDNMPV